ncbi:MAG: hypothetical protein ACNA7W_21065 [Pseudomonadales bacterium]
MQVTVELSLYPLDKDYLPSVVAFIKSLQANQQSAPAGQGIDEIVVNQMSTQLRGDLAAVQHAITQALLSAHAQGSTFSLVVKYLNADLPLSAVVDLDDGAPSLP